MMARAKVTGGKEAVISPVEPKEKVSFEEAYKLQNPAKYETKKKEGQFNKLT